MAKNEVIKTTDSEIIIPETRELGGFYQSFKVKTEADQAKLFNMLSSDGKRIKDMINRTITFRDFTIEVVELVNEETGETNSAPRIAIMNMDDDLIYQCTSGGIANSLRNLIRVKGNPEEWEKPVTMKVTQISRGDRSILSMTMV